MVDTQTELHELEPPLQRGASSSSGSFAAGSSSAADADASARCVLDQLTQRKFYDLLRKPLTALQHETALRRHASVTNCQLSDVLRVSDLGQRVFFMVPLRSRGE